MTGRASWRHGLAALAVASLVAVALYGSLVERPFGFDLSIRGVQSFVLNLGPWGVLGMILLMILHCVIPFPSELISISAGYIYGWKEGTAIVWTGAMIGAVISYAAAWTLGRPLIHALLPEKHYATFEKWSLRATPGLLLLSRLVPVISFNLINYAAGAAKVPWWTFIWTTSIGILPLTLFTVWLGERLQRPTAMDWLLFGLGLIAIWGFGYIAKRSVNHLSGDSPDGAV